MGERLRFASAGLENACDDGVVGRGQFVLFNGASFLLDPEPVSLKASQRGSRQLGTKGGQPCPLCSVKAVVYILGVMGGIPWALAWLTSPNAHHP